MSEPAVKYRQPIDLDEFERRLRGPAPVARGGDDPLAELARLVGGDSPFVQRPAVRAVEPPAPAPVEPPVEEPPALRGAYAEPVSYEPEIAHAAPAASAPSHDFTPLEPEAPRFTAEPHVSLPPADVPPALRATREPPVLQFPEQVADEPPYIPPPPYPGDEEVAAPKRSRRMIYLASTALLLIVGGVGVALVSGRGVGVGVGGAPPTIMAAQGPVKVQPANPGGAELRQQSSTVLDRGQVERVGASRVVGREEQPVDLAQAARSAPPRDSDSTAGAAPSAPAASSGFPEPKRVRTVSVRPDGTIIAGDGAPAPVASPLGAAPTRSISSIPLNPSGPRPIAPPAASAPAPAAAPPAPVATAPAATAPQKTTTRIASATPTGSISDADAGKPKPVPVKPAPKPTPAASSGGSGGFAVQLAAPGSEAEARDAIARLQKRFSSELGSHRLAMVRAQVGEKSIYRVRATGLSQTDANSLCGSIKSSGGACFVAKN